ncbi:hypothetical protein Patl1_30240 [Pistacia atlantica]|uniref:Uncharacterized protein n=1 Tax=Pistacia atlantica TaxID=434234 RepID=A0ACC1AA11_9ROSI|nr:hypothetical protein Patl1_30240 [Pistacia atlantica]
MSATIMSPLKAAETSIGRTIDKVSGLLIHEQELLLGFDKEFRFIETELKRMHLMLKSVKGGDGAMSSNNNEPVLTLLTEDMRLLASRVDAVADAFLSRKGKQKIFPNLELPEGPSSYNDMDEEEAVSLEEDATLLASRLISGQGSRGVISISGGTGIGKTTLALKVYKHATVVQNFPARAWVTLPC